MRIEYEVDDIVEIEDNMEAGTELSARVVRLIKQTAPARGSTRERWIVEDIETNKQDFCEARFFHPR